jgi:putative tricarboxylic transport membrane protein
METGAGGSLRRRFVRPIFSEDHMSEGTQHTGGAGPSYRAVEIGTAMAMIALGVVVIIGSLRVGTGWGAEGPKSGFFPFYLGIIIVGGSIFNLIQAASARDLPVLFAEWGQLRQVLAVIIPTAVYVGVIPWIGIYVSSIVLIALFMIWLGNYRITFALPVAAGVMIAVYLTFEKWFLVPLPKGPLEDLLGL